MTIEQQYSWAKYKQCGTFNHTIRYRLQQEHLKHIECIIVIGVTVCSHLITLCNHIYCIVI